MTSTECDDPSPRAARASLVVNTGSRRGHQAFGRARELLRDRFPDSFEAEAVHTGAELAAALDRAVASAPDLLVVGGGDGSLGCAARRIAGTSIVLGVLPLGTANDFARTLEIPTAVAEAVRTMVEGKVVDVDLGMVNGLGFLNVTSAGLSVEVTRALTPALKRRLGPLAYAWAAVLAYRRQEPFQTRLSFPDGDHRDLVVDDVLQVAVGNGRHYGGGMTISPTASLDDHLLDAYVIERGRLRDHLSIARLFRDGRFIEHDRVHQVTTRRVEVRTLVAGEQVSLPLNVDGELAAETPAQFEIRRNALRVMVPRDSHAAQLDCTVAETGHQDGDPAD